ncbi:MAG: MBL fold metallo-hydrolase [Gammaproteobacteria bacterium]|jgi:hypothetical protein
MKDGTLEELYPGVFRVYPTKITETKYVSFFVKRRGGNLLFPCFASHSTIEGTFDEIERKGGIALQLIGDMHFAARHNDDVTARFKIPALCSEIEVPDVKRKVKHVATFPYTRHEVASRVEAIPTPGHRPGAVSYLVTLGSRRHLFAGDTLYHDGEHWRVYTNKKQRKQMIETLRMLSELEFDVLLANTRALNPICHVELSARARQRLMNEIESRL